MEDAENNGANEQISQEVKVLREKISDPTYLPTFKEVSGAFPGGYRETENYKSYCRKNHVFEFFSREFVASLGDYLQQRVPDIRKEEKPTVILEVGAGKGQLTEWLKKHLKSSGLDENSVQIIATDDRSWPVAKESSFPVKDIGFREAIKKLKPNIVLVSWMPPREDWTPTFRNQDSVQEYVLIGESDGGCCGKSETWEACPQENEISWPETDLSPSFYRVDLNGDPWSDETITHQIGRTDDLPLELGTSNSHTVSFRRRN